MGRPPRSPNAPKGRNLARNVFNNGNADAVRKSSESLLTMLRDPKRSDEAVEMIKTFAMEADPSKPGYEGNEIVASMARALGQLQADRRASLLEAAGNPDIFKRIKDGSDPLGDPSDLKMPEGLKNILGELFPEPDAVDLAEPDELRAELKRYGVNAKGMADAELPGAVREWRAATQAFGNPSTYGGKELWQQVRQYDDRAPINRDLPRDEQGVPTVFDKGGNPVRPMTEQEITDFQQQLTRQIVGSEMSNQIAAIRDKGGEPSLPVLKGPAIAQNTVTIGTGRMTGGGVSVQGPYRNKAGQTMDTQLEQSATSPASKGMDELYRARRQLDAEGAGFGEEEGNKVVLPNLDYLYEPWRARFPMRGSGGAIEYPDFAPTGEFIARQFAAAKKMNPDAIDGFVRELAPVFDAMISRQATTKPTTQRAASFDNKPLVPPQGRDAAWTKFQQMPQAEVLQRRMFNEAMPLNRGAVDLSGLLDDASGAMPQQPQFRPYGDTLDQPVRGGGIDDAPTDALDMPADPLDMPVDGGSINDLGYMMPPMNNRQRQNTALSALLA